MKPANRVAMVPIVAVAIGSIIAVGCAGLLRQSNSTNFPSEASIERRLTSIRGLQFLQPISVEVEAPQDAASLTLDKVASRTSASRLREKTAVGEEIGLHEYGFDLRAATLKTARSEVAGLYDPGSRQVVLVRQDRGGGSNEAESRKRQVLLAHELTHALQYQHFEIERKLETASTRYDRYLAFNAVLEGDATFTSLAYAQRRPLDHEAVEKMKTRLREASWLQAFTAKGPRLDQLVEYLYGTLFVMEAFERGGWAGVNRLYLQPPRSCREIMDPPLYFDQTRRPKFRIDLAGYEDVMDGWTESYRDTLGVVPLMAILARGVKGKDRQIGLSLRWSDDEIIVLRNDKRFAVIWMIAFDDRDSAWAFEQSYVSVLDNVSRGEPHGIDRRNRTVLITIGEAATRFASLGPAVWSATKLAGTGRGNRGE